jgi:hypothetical protein
LRNGSEEEKPDRQHQFFVHGALVGNSGKMLPWYRKLYFDQKTGRDSQTSVRCSVPEVL